MENKESFFISRVIRIFTIVRKNYETKTSVNNNDSFNLAEMNCMPRVRVMTSMKGGRMRWKSRKVAPSRIMLTIVLSEIVHSAKESNRKKG